MIGIGGALTDASAEVFARLPEASQKEFLTAYYDTQKGIGYNFAGTTIARCDFSGDIYGYVADNDSLLTSFNVDHDKKFRIPFIKQSIAFINPDGKIVVVVLNLSDEKLPFRLCISGKAAAVASLPRSIMTMIIR